MAMWNHWRECKKVVMAVLIAISIKGDAKHGINTAIIEKTKDFSKPVEHLKNGNYKMKPGIVYTCFSTDFLIAEADEWRNECWQIIRERPDCASLPSL